MREFLILCVFVAPIFAAPESSYKYREPAPVVEKNGLTHAGPPCKHASNAYNFDAATTALIKAQSEARIVNNKGHYIADHNLETAASGYSPQSHGGSNQFSATNKFGSFQGGSSNNFVAGQGYVQNTVSSGGFQASHIAHPPINYIPVSQISPPPIPTQSHHAPQISTTLTQSSHNNGYNYNQAGGAHQQQQQQQQQHFQANQGFSSFPIPPNHRPQASQHSSGNFVAQHAGNFGGQQSGNFAGQHSSNFGGQHTSNVIALDSYTSSSIGANGLTGHLGSVIRETVANAPLDPFAEKHIYVHIPPEDMEASSHQASFAAPQFVAPPKKHYKIVFIKAPTHAAPNYSQLAAAAAPKVEEKTLIYVLVKKPEEPNLDQIQELTQSLHKSSKPEVYFIKYKTQKEGELSHIPAQLPSGIPLSADHVDITTGDSNGFIDIRAGGVGGSSVNVEGPKHELYGVPLQ